MACLGVEPGAAGWKAQTNPLSYGGTPQKHKLLQFLSSNHSTKMKDVHGYSKICIREMVCTDRVGSRS